MLLQITDTLNTSEVSNAIDILEILCRMGVDILFAGIIILFIHYRNYKNNEFVFTYFMLLFSSLPSFYSR